MVDTLGAVKLLIAGGRTFTDYDLLVDEVIDFLGTAKPKPTIISGVAAGATLMAIILGWHFVKRTEALIEQITQLQLNLRHRRVEIMALLRD